MPNDTAQLHLEAVGAAMRTYDFAAAAESAAKAYEADPDDLETNQAFLQLYPMRRHRFDGRKIEIDDPDEAKREGEELRRELRGVYESKAASNPGSPIWPFLLSQLATAAADHEAAERHLTHAVSVDPSFTRAHDALAILCQKRGDNDGHLAHLRAAAEVNTDDANAAFTYAYALDGTARASALLAFVERFPGFPRTPQALMEAADEEEDPAERRRLLERALDASEGGDFEVYVRTQLVAEIADVDPLAAASIAAAAGAQYADAANALVKTAEARDYLERGDGARALAALGAETEQPTFGSDLALEVRIKALLQGGETDEARSVLVARLADRPSARIDALVESVGPRVELDAAVWARRDAQSETALDFTAQAIDGSTVSLAELRGTVVLLNFWYPGCGPCRREFRYLAPIVRRFAGRPLEVVALNTVEGEDPLVEPFARGNDLPFRLALYSSDVVERYGIVATPQNFLIDHRGMVVGKPGIYDRRTSEALEHLLDSVVKRAEREGRA